METTVAFMNIKKAIDNAPRKAYTAELHLQMIKYAEVLTNVSGDEFCKTLSIPPSFKSEFSKMRKIASRLVSAGLDVDKI